MRVLRKSCIEDEFEGWDGDTVYELDDGSKWELVNYTYTYTYKYRPRARIWQDGSDLYLDVEGMPKKVKVRRVD